MPILHVMQSPTGSCIKQLVKTKAQTIVLTVKNVYSKKVQNLKKSLVKAGVELTAELVNHFLPIWFFQECTTAVTCLFSTSMYCKEQTKEAIH